MLSSLEDRAEFVAPDDNNDDVEDKDDEVRIVDADEMVPVVLETRSEANFDFRLILGLSRLVN